MAAERKAVIRAFVNISDISDALCGYVGAVEEWLELMFILNCELHYNSQPIAN